MKSILKIWFVLNCCSLLLIAESLIDQKIYRPTAADLSNPNVYPQRSVYGIKAIQPDDWKIEDFTGNGVGGVVLNCPW